ncbi:MAG: VanZ family protein [Arenicella sp.]|jgi:VanZ family protein
MKISNISHKRASYLTLILQILGALFKIEHLPYAGTLLSVGIIGMLICALIALAVVIANKKESVAQKIFWLLSLILSMPLGLYFYFSRRKRVEAESLED